jgi:hypothetical protein
VIRRFEEIDAGLAATMNHHHRVRAVWFFGT